MDDGTAGTVERTIAGAAGASSAPRACYAVDPDRLRAAVTACRDVAGSMQDSAVRLVRARQEAADWAADGGLGTTADRLLSVLVWTAQACAREAHELADRLAAVSAGYAAADVAVTAGDASAIPGR